MNKSSGSPDNFLKDTYWLVSGKSASFTRSMLLFPMLLALLLRLPLLMWPEAIYNDSTIYVHAAKGILRGNWSETVVPPFYPMLIAFTNSMCGDFELSGILVSVVFGILLVIPVFYLGMELYSARVGMIAALLAAVQPYLFKYSGSVLTESLYYTLIAAIVLMAMRCLNTGKHINAALFGTLTAIGYLVRPEAVGFLIVFGVWILFFTPAKIGWPFLRRFSLVLLAGFCFIIFSSPYLLLLRKELGRWELSKKVSVMMNTLEGENSAEVLPGEAFQKKQLTVRSFLHNPIPFMKAIISGPFLALYKYQQAFNPVLFLLVFWGFWRRKGGYRPWRQNLFVLSFVLFFFALVFPMFRVSPRYTSHMIPIALPWAAYGFLGFITAISSWKIQGKFAERATPLILLLLMAGLLTQGIEQRKREHRMVQKQAGLWLKENVPRGQKLMSRTVQEAFYADMVLVRMPEGNFEEAIKAARSQSIRFIIIDEKTRKQFQNFDKESHRHGLVLLRSWEKGKREVSVFEITKP